MHDSKLDFGDQSYSIVMQKGSDQGQVVSLLHSFHEQKQYLSSMQSLIKLLPKKGWLLSLEAVLMDSSLRVKWEFTRNIYQYHYSWHETGFKIGIVIVTLLDLVFLFFLFYVCVVVGNRMTWCILRLEDTYGAKIRPPLNVSLNNSVNRPSFRNMRDNFLTKWPRM